MIPKSAVVHPTVGAGLKRGCPWSATSLLFCLLFVFACMCGDEEEPPVRTVDGTGGYRYAVYADNCVKIVKSPHKSQKDKICSGKAWEAIMAEVGVKMARHLKKPKKPKKQRSRRRSRGQEVRVAAQKQLAAGSGSNPSDVWGSQPSYTPDPYSRGGQSADTRATGTPATPSSSGNDVWGTDGSQPPVRSAPVRRNAQARVVGTPDIMGSLPRSQFNAVFRQRLASFRRCYAARLAEKPSLAGRIRLRFEINKNGRVRQLSIDQTTVDDRDVGSCVIAQVKQMQFPVSPDGRANIVTQSLQFLAE